MKKHDSNASYFPAEALLKEVEVEIGGQRVDKIYSDWFRVYDELYRSGSEKDTYRSMVDFDDASAGGDTGVTKRFYVPLIFFYNKAPGLALPLVALQYHEVKINILFENATVMANAGVDSSVEPTCQLFSTFVYLDTEERKRFSQQSHEVRREMRSLSIFLNPVVKFFIFCVQYLITTLQHTGAESVTPGSSARTHNVRLSLNHPVRVLSWVIKQAGIHGKFTTQASGETSDKFAPLKEARLQLNGHDRFDSRHGAYFNKVQPYEHVSPAPKPAAGVYSYHFGLRSNEQVQPSGSCNFSRIDNATLVVTTKAASVATTDPANAITTEDVTYANAEGNLTSLLVFAESYNVLRILSGMVRHLISCFAKKTVL